MAVKRDNIEDLYRLSPVQEGMLFHCLRSDDPGTYLQQFVFALEGELDAEAFRGVWQEVVDRIPALRTAFVWEREGRPLQVVVRQARQPTVLETWDETTEDTARADLREFLRQDQERSFDLAKPPLSRLTLIRVGDGRLHYMVWTYHHLILDGWSMGLVLGEVLRRYRAMHRGEELDLPEPPSFRRYIAWLERQDLDAAEAWWRQHLEGLEGLTPLPEPGSSPAGGGGKITHHLSPATTEALSATARRHRVTLNTLAQGAWALLLSRHSGQGDVVYGTVVSGRPAELEGVESMVGMFINTLPSRVGVDPGRGLGEWLRGLQECQLAMRRFESTPLPQIQGWSGLGAGHSLFESLLVFENRALFGVGPRPDAGEVQMRPVDFQGETGYPLAAVVEPGTALALTLGFGPRYAAATAERLLRQFGRLLESMVENPQGRVADLELLTEAERRQLLDEWNDTGRGFGDSVLTRRIAEQVARTPEAVALVDGGATLTYGELQRRARRMARRLRRGGVGPEAIVGILLRRSVEYVVAIYAVLEAGAAFLPLDPEHPIDRIASTLADAGARLVLSRGDLAAAVQAATVPVIDLAREEPIGEGPADEGFHEAPAPIHPEQLAYVIYTSGSTGKPKGVMVSHGEIDHTLAWRPTVYPLGPEDRVLQVTSFSFDVSIGSIFGTLSSGARLLLTLPEGAAGKSALAEHLRRGGATVIQLPMSLLRLLVEELEAAGDGADTLREVLCGGELMTPELQEAFYRRLGRRPDGGPGARLSNCYGPTETCLDATYWICPADDSRSKVPIGRPIRGKRVYVADPRQRLLPAGAVGELLIGGDGLARGYLGDPRLTATRFLPDPWSPEPGARVYRSGDLVRFVEDGLLEIIGRIDHQVKVRGYRIELGEIEAALTSHPDVSHGAVGVDGEAAPRLVAYVVTRRPLPPEELESFLGARLPKYMMPSVWMALDAIPLNASGKVDRRRLPSPTAIRRGDDTSFAPPESAAETRLAEVWAAVLGLERVGRHDNFFELGGDSILCLQVVARARKAGLSLSVRQIFDSDTLADLARAAAEGRAVEAEQGPVTGKVPLTPIQCWFFDEVRSDRHHFNQAVLLEIRRPVSAEVVARALYHLLRHHDALRQAYAPDGETWRQWMAPPPDEETAAELLLERFDFTGVPDEGLAEALEQAADGLHTSFDLGSGILLRAGYFDLGAERPGRLLLVIHHLAVDGVSWRVLIEDLTAACEQICAGKGLALPPKTTAFKTWAERLEAHAASAELAEELSYWLALGDSAPGPLPRDFDSGDNSEASAEHVHVELEPDVTAALIQDVPRSYGTRIDDVLLSAVVSAFQTWTGESRLMLELEGHGREDLFEGIDLSRTVGWFTAEYPIVLDVGHGRDPGRLLRSIKEQLRGVPHRGLGWGVARYLGEEPTRRELAELPRPEVLFNYLGQFDSSLPEGSPWGPAREPTGQTRATSGPRHYLLELNGHVAGGRLRFDFTYSPHLHRRETVEALGAAFLDALRRLVAHCASVRIGGYVPADFPLASVDQALVDRLTASGRPLEDLYPLSPMQQGMLFDSLYARVEGTNVMQLSCRIHGELDEEAFRRAWREIVDRHAALRTAFVWEGCAEPHQVVFRELSPNLARYDWRGLGAEEQEERFATLAGERRKGFDLAEAPLTRFDLVRLSESSWRFAWTSHHLILDGWSTPVLYGELITLYETLRRGGTPALAPPAPYRDYVAWLSRQDLAKTRDFWRRSLAGFEGSPAPETWKLPATLRGADTGRGGHHLSVNAERTARLREVARRRRLTLGTLIQGAWALVLGHHAGRNDVAFGTTVAGRPADLPGVESMVGMFINTLPVRVSFDPGAPLGPWLLAHQDRQAALREHEHSPLARIREWGGLAAEAELFASILVFENYPVPEGGGDAGLRMDDFRYEIRESFPLILDVGPGESLSLKLRFDPGLYDANALDAALGDLRAVLEHFLADDTWNGDRGTLREVLELLDRRRAKRHQAREEKAGQSRRRSLKGASRRGVELPRKER